MKIYLFSFALMFCAVGFVNGQDKTQEAIKFMMKFGYLADFGEKTAALYSKEGIKEAIKKMQSYGGLVQTGIIDQATLALFTKPRCGVKDVEPENNLLKIRPKRYVIASDGWQKDQISYRLENFPRNIPRQVVMRQFRQAFKVWSDISPLRFQQTFGHKADMDIKFESRRHDDNYPFDGPGNVLAHAFFPHITSEIRGDVHFDMDEKWQDQSNDDSSQIDGVDLYTVAAHEIGHSLGLSHSNDTESLMFPYYKGFVEPEKIIGRDDILAMRELYLNRRNRNEITKARTRPTRRATTRQRPTTRNPITRPTRTATRRTTPRRITLEDRSVSRLTRPPFRGIGVTPEGRIRRITRPTRRPSPRIDKMELPNLCEGSFDAMSVIRGELMIFKKNFMWRYRSKGVLTPGFPGEFKRFFYKFPPEIKKIDALYQREDGKIIFFTGPEYWVYDGTNFIENSPQPLSELGLPLHIQKIDAALFRSKEKATYLFTNDRYYRYDEAAHCVEPRTPTMISRKSGMPTNIDNAMEWKDGRSYIFKNKHFWILKNSTMEVSEVYPHRSPEVWGGYRSC